MKHVQSLFPWLLRGVDFDNDSAFMNDVVVPWCREQKLEVTRSRAYKKNDQAFVERKNGAVVRRPMGYGRFDGTDTARVMSRLYGVPLGGGREGGEKAGGWLLEIEKSPRHPRRGQG